MVHPGGLVPARGASRSPRGAGAWAPGAGRARAGSESHRLRREHAAGRPSRQPHGGSGRDAGGARSPSARAGPRYRARQPRRGPRRKRGRPDRLLATTHVHDNNGRQDSHEPPGHGTIDWSAWGPALDSIGYGGPILLECIRHLRQNPSKLQARSPQRESLKSNG